MTYFRHKIAIVTGGASGIGRAVAEKLASMGAMVVVADINDALADEVAEGILARGGRAEASHLDVTDPSAVQDLVEGVAERHGRLDLLFNNAGIAVVGELLETPLSDWRKMVEVNIMGVAHGVAAAYPLMKGQGFGHIVNTASVAGLVTSPHFAAYSATKHAVVGLTRALRAEASAHGVHASAVCPGLVKTPLMKHSTILHEARMSMSREELISGLPLRPVTAAACADAILRGVEKKREIIVVSTHAKVMFFFQRLNPATIQWASRAMIRRMRAVVNL